MKINDTTLIMDIMWHQRRVHTKYKQDNGDLVSFIVPISFFFDGDFSSHFFFFSFFVSIFEENVYLLAP